MALNLTRQIKLTAVWLVIGMTPVFAQTNVSSTSDPDREGLTVVPEKLTATDVSTVSNLRPDRPERKDLPPEVKERIEHFKIDARAYLEKREALKKQLEGANDKERALIRRQIEELRRQWLQRARELRKEFRERLPELRDKLPDYHEVLDSSRNALLQAQEDARPRRTDTD